jgi:hypothetical protein
LLLFFLPHSKLYPPFYSVSKSNLIYRHQTHTTNPAHQSVACASTYFRMSVLMRKAGSFKHIKRLIEAPFFGFHFVIMKLKIKWLYKNCSFSVFENILLFFPFVSIPLFFHNRFSFINLRHNTALISCSIK